MVASLFNSVLGAVVAPGGDVPRAQRRLPVGEACVGASEPLILLASDAFC